MFPIFNRFRNSFRTALISLIPEANKRVISQQILKMDPASEAVQSSDHKRKAEESVEESGENGAGNEKVNKKMKSELKKKRKTIEVIDTSLDVSDYYIENGLRKVYPYVHPFYSYCKGRWIGLTLKELFKKEFRYCPEAIMEKRIKNGHLKVNHEVADLSYVLRDGDFITHRIHRHEFPVLAVPIPVIHMDDELLVIDKPPSMPIHPCGKYRLNTVISILEKENKLKDIHVIHRLDRLTSGIMIMARTRAQAQKVHEKMRNREMHKEYLCRVVGKFPDGIIEVDQPLETLSHKVGICIVSPKGKESRTTFERVNYNGVSSTVLAKPHTGRMHQIRVHLQWLGYPIVNDSFYNTEAWGDARGKNCEYGKSMEELIKDVELEHQRANHVVGGINGDGEGNRSDEGHVADGDTPPSNVTPLNDPSKDPARVQKDEIAIRALEHYFSQSGWSNLAAGYELDASKLSAEMEDCFDCQNPTFDPTPSEQLIYLHALRYRSEDWSFETDIPVWAKDTWNHD